MSAVEHLRIPPHSVDAEQAVLGGLMLAPDALASVSWLKPEDFYRRDHGLIFRALQQCAEAGRPADAVTLADWLEEQGQAEASGGMGYLIELANGTASAANITAYAEIVREKAQLRRLGELGTELVNDVLTPGKKSSRDLAGLAASRLLELSGGEGARGPRTFKQVGKLWFDQLMARMGGTTRGLLTPWAGLNRLTGGLNDGELIVLAGRPGMGKSAAMIGLSLCAALQGRRVLAFQLEMTDTAMFQRAVAAEASVPLSALKAPDDSGDYWDRVHAAVSKLRDAPLAIDETPGLTIDQIVLRAKREHMRSPLRLVLIDHMHIVALRGENEPRELGEVSRKCKTLAKALGCPVVLLAQLNRGVEARTCRRPVMSDLRGSGAIEQDADVIVFLYRDDYYAEQEGRASDYPGAVEFIVAKNREGESGKAWGRSMLHMGRIDDHEGPEPQPLAKARRTRKAAGFDAAKAAAGDDEGEPI